MQQPRKAFFLSQVGRENRHSEAKRIRDEQTIHVQMTHWGIKNTLRNKQDEGNHIPVSGLVFLSFQNRLGCPLCGIIFLKINLSLLAVESGLQPIEWEWDNDYLTKH